MNEFYLMVWLFMASAPGVEGPKMLLSTSYSAGPFSGEGCKNAQRAVSALVKGGNDPNREPELGSITVCVPKDIAKLDVAPKKETAPKKPWVPMSSASR